MYQEILRTDYILYLRLVFKNLFHQTIERCSARIEQESHEKVLNKRKNGNETKKHTQVLHRLNLLKQFAAWFIVRSNEIVAHPKEDYAEKAYCRHGRYAS